MSDEREPILLLGGAGLPAWIWDDVRRELGGERELRVADRPDAGATRLTDHVHAALASAPPGRFAVVAHSAGGVVGAELAWRAPERVSAFLGVSAVVPAPGGSFLSAMPAPNRWVLGAVLRLAGTRPPEAAIRRSLAHGLDEELADRIVADFATEPLGLFADRTSAAGWGGPRGYVRTTDDRELPESVQRRSARHLAADWHAELDTGHLPMLEDPVALAGTIRRFLDQPGPATPGGPAAV